MIEAKFLRNILVDSKTRTIFSSAPEANLQPGRAVTQVRSWPWT